MKSRPSPALLASLVFPLLAALALPLVLLLSGCESPMAESADRAAYNLVAQRQKEVLRRTSDTKITDAVIPYENNKEMLARVPPTINDLSLQALTPASQDSTQPQTAPASSQAATQTASTQGATSPSIDALLQNLPGIDLTKMPELPEFPRPAPAGKTRQALSLDDAFNIALLHNRDYVSRKEDLFLSALNVTLERHAFEPQPFARTTLGVTGVGESGDYAAAFNATQTLGVRQRLPMGGEIVAQALAATVHSLRKSANEDTGQGSLNAVIPLLRGAGTVAQEDLISAERSLVYTIRDFEHYRRGFLVAVSAQYFSLVNQRAQIINRFRNVRSYIFITERSKALFNAGLATRRTTLLDVMRAAQSEYQARNSLITAIEQYEFSLDQFKILLGMAVDQPIDVTPQYLAIAPPNISEAAAVKIAFDLRLDLQTSHDQVDDARRAVKNSVNNLLPDLNFNTTATLANNRIAKNVLPNFQNLDYNTNLTLDIPLDRLAERNAYRAANVQLARARRSVETFESQVTSQVQAAMRAVKEQQAILAIQKSNIDLAQKRKAFSDIQFRDGKIDNRDYLDAETALLDAQNSFARALSDLEIAVLQYLRDTDQLRVDFTGHLQLPNGATSVSINEGKPPATEPAIRPTTLPEIPLKHPVIF